MVRKPKTVRQLRDTALNQVSEDSQETPEERHEAAKEVRYACELCSFTAKHQDVLASHKDTMHPKSREASPPGFAPLGGDDWIGSTKDTVPPREAREILFPGDHPLPTADWRQRETLGASPLERAPLAPLGDLEANDDDDDDDDDDNQGEEERAAAPPAPTLSLEEEIQQARQTAEDEIQARVRAQIQMRLINRISARKLTLGELVSVFGSLPVEMGSFQVADLWPVPDHKVSSLAPRKEAPQPQLRLLTDLERQGLEGEIFATLGKLGGQATMLMLGKLLAMETKELRGPLKQLIKRGLLRTEGEKRSMRYIKV